MRQGVRWTSILGLLLAAVGLSYALDQKLTGKQELVKDPKLGVDLSKRGFIGQGMQKASPVTIVGDPTVGGASLEVFAFGATSSNQSFVLPQGTDPATGKPFWSGSATKGFKYADKAGTNGAVKVVQFKKSSSGTVSFKALGVGKNGPINLVPPIPAPAGACSSRSPTATATTCSSTTTTSSRRTTTRRS